MNILFALLRRTGRLLIFTSLISVSVAANAQLVLESFGFSGEFWDFSHSSKLEMLNKTPINPGYSFVRFQNPETMAEVSAFIINDGQYLTVCNPDIQVVLPLLRDLAQAYAESDLAQRVILETQVQQNLISTCSKSFTSALELKREFSRAAGYESLAGLTYP